MKHLWKFIAAISCLAMLAAPLRAQVSQAAQDSTVRIICSDPGDDGVSMKAIRLNVAGEKFVAIPGWGSGTGFVVSEDGYIVTNNHVVAESPTSEVAKKLIFVIQHKSDGTYTLHLANVVRMSANKDLALIQCPELRTSPIPLCFKAPPTSSEVFSIGFPGLADVGIQDPEKVHARQMKFLNALQKMIKDKNLKLTNKDADDLGAFANIMSSEFNIFLQALNEKASDSLSATKRSCDITDVIEKRPLWKEYFNPTVTKGNLERTAEHAGFGDEDRDNISVIQHSCHIMHGNSGGPLLNSAGDVIGVVGRGVGRDTDNVEWATNITEAKDWLTRLKVPIIERDGTPPPPPVSQKLIYIVAGAAALAMAALVLALLKPRKSSRSSHASQGPGVTTLVNERVAKALAKAKQTPVEVTSSMLPTSLLTTGDGKRWMLSGRLPSGEALRFELTETFFKERDNKIVLGRSDEVTHFAIRDSSVSRQHAHIRRNGTGGFVVADRNSSNRTAVNGQFSTKPFEEVPLREGDTLTLGDIKLDFVGA